MIKSEKVKELENAIEKIYKRKYYRRICEENDNLQLEMLKKAIKLEKKISCWELQL